jgi:myo-inositol-1(or 4)-monophosphatase
MNKKLNFTKRIIKNAGKILLNNFNKIQDIQFKSAKDIVTQTDKETEKYIVNSIKNNFPDDNILAEENAIKLKKQDSDNLWIIDPLDGTTNYLHKLPYFCISIAYSENNILKFGCIYAPKLNELFYAELNKGAYLNNKKISVTNTDKFINAMGVTGFACLRANKKINNLNNFVKFAPKLRGIRRLGSAALDFCYTAAGRFDFFWEMNLNPWDVSAGIIIVREAGGKVTDFNNNSDKLDGTEIVATNKILHNKVLKILK